MARVKYLNDIDRIIGLSGNERRRLAAVAERYRFRASDYYLNLIDWDDPDDPIRKIVIPHISELEEFGELDASDEEFNYVAPGCQHKYTSTALLLCNENCGCYCRFCFRKRLFMNKTDEVVNEISAGFDYIRQNEEINNVLLTGGDPLLMSTGRLESIIRPLRKIDHVRIIRIGTKIPAFNPYRIIDDPELPKMLARYSTLQRRIYIMTHFNHPRELTDDACLALDLLMKAGTVLCNQTPILRGINDSAETLEQLMRRLSDIGVSPYYFFQCRPTAGNIHFVLPLVATFGVFEAARRKLSGLAKRARLVMSHFLGKVEIVGLSEQYLYLKFHRSRSAADKGRFLIFHRDDNAFWLDELVLAEESPHPVARFGHRRAHVIGPE